MPPKKPVQSAVPWDELKRPFDDDEVTWRVVNNWLDSKKRPHAKLSCYVHASVLRKRLDSVLTAGGWQTAFRNLQMNKQMALVCRLGIKVRDEWVCREGAVDLGKEDPSWEDSTATGAVSMALRAACLQFGIGVDMYGVGEVRAEQVHTSVVPGDRPVLEFKSKADSANGVITVPAWCERPKLSELRK